MFCKLCGAQLSENARFCSSCGTRVDPVPEWNTQDKAIARAKEDLKNYLNAGIKKYSVLTGKECACCNQFANKILNVSEAVIGRNFPPFHEGCVCTTVAEFSDDE